MNMTRESENKKQKYKNVWIYILYINKLYFYKTYNYKIYIELFSTKKIWIRDTNSPT